VFSESYTKRLSSGIKPAKDKDKDDRKKGLPTKNSFISFLVFAVLTLSILSLIIEWSLKSSA